MKYIKITNLYSDSVGINTLQEEKIDQLKKILNYRSNRNMVRSRPLAEEDEALAERS
jgi:hypothetical protein